ncbi:hypothetical protein D3C76_1246570 [compost metagenome]
MQAIKEADVVEKDPEKSQKRQLQPLPGAGSRQRYASQQYKHQQRRTGQQETQAGGKQRAEAVGEKPPRHEGTAPDHGDRRQFEINRNIGRIGQALFTGSHKSPGLDRAG